MLDWLLNTEDERDIVFEISPGYLRLTMHYIPDDISVNKYFCEDLLYYK